MILGVRTDKPEATITIAEENRQLAHDEWLAGRTLAASLVEHIRSLLTHHHLKWEDVSGLVLYQGPGSFTGLRIGATVMNTIAYCDSLPIVGVTGDEWLTDGITRLGSHENDGQVLPEYGAEPNITKPGKRSA